MHLNPRKLISAVRNFHQSIPVSLSLIWSIFPAHMFVSSTISGFPAGRKTQAVCVVVPGSKLSEIMKKRSQVACVPRSRVGFLPAEVRWGF
jgi:hypothetical protein